MSTAKKKRAMKATPEPNPLPPMRPAPSAAAEVFGIAELLERILLELALDLQHHAAEAYEVEPISRFVKLRRELEVTPIELEPMSTIVKLRRVNKFFRNNIEGSRKIQELLPYASGASKPEYIPLRWLLKKKLGLNITGLTGDMRSIGVWINAHLLGGPAGQHLVEFQKKGECGKEAWRKIKALGQNYEQWEAVPFLFAVQFKAKAGLGLKRPRKWDQRYSLDSHADLGAVYDAYITMRERVTEKYERRRDLGKS